MTKIIGWLVGLFWILIAIVSIARGEIFLGIVIGIVTIFIIPPVRQNYLRFSIEESKKKGEEVNYTDEYKWYHALLPSVIILIAIIFLGDFDKKNRSDKQDSKTEVISYKIEKQECLEPYKCSYDIRLYKKLDKKDITFLAKKIKAQTPKVDRTFILYYLPCMVIDDGAWASSHYNPGLSVSIMEFMLERNPTCLTSENNQDAKVNVEITKNYPKIEVVKKIQTIIKAHHPACITSDASDTLSKAIYNNNKAIQNALLGTQCITFLEDTPVLLKDFNAFSASVIQIVDENGKIVTLYTNSVKRQEYYESPVPPLPKEQLPNQDQALDYKASPPIAYTFSYVRFTGKEIVCFSQDALTLFKQATSHKKNKLINKLLNESCFYPSRDLVAIKGMRFTAFIGDKNIQLWSNDKAIRTDRPIWMQNAQISMDDIKSWKQAKSVNRLMQSVSYLVVENDLLRLKKRFNNLNELRQMAGILRDCIDKKIGTTPSIKEGAYVSDLVVDCLQSLKWGRVF